MRFNQAVPGRSRERRPAVRRFAPPSVTKPYISFKTVEDYVVSIIALIFTCPIMLAAATAIYIESSGPILFRQRRVGLNQPFMMYKFRTMTVDPTDDGSYGPRRDCARITRVGRIFRGTSIDELPQLIDVLSGEMSIVGSRPRVPNMVMREGIYSEVVPRYSGRHCLKPGITGWAQINGVRGGIDSVEKARGGADLGPLRCQLVPETQPQDPDTHNRLRPRRSRRFLIVGNSKKDTDLLRKVKPRLDLSFNFVIYLLGLNMHRRVFSFHPNETRGSSPDRGRYSRLDHQQNISRVRRALSRQVALSHAGQR
jgi:lipopolysaccharide/colanic/teichoic acid biosynthesis glycosyltransferase